VGNEKFAVLWLMYYNLTIRDRRKYGREEKGGSVGMDTPPQRGPECIWVSGVIKSGRGLCGVDGVGSG
jgi:hypothetical protein